MRSESKPSPSAQERPALAAERAKHSEELAKVHIGPLWEIYRKVLTRKPARREVPHLWPWSLVRPHLVRAGELITAAEAERRALMLLNPATPSGFGATATLYAAAQLILPGESARAHRHSPAALRFVIEGEGAFTCVDGDKIVMSPGDLILTPSMVWHDHGNEGANPVMWLDGLDIPLMDSLRYMFLQEFETTSQQPQKPPRYSERLYGRALFPAGMGPGCSGVASPVWAYRSQEAQDALECLRRTSEPDPFDAYMLRYANPANGRDTFPTMGCRLQLIPNGAHTSAHRHTASTVYHVAEGNGFSVLDGVRFDWRKGDTFAVPIWCWHEHAAGGTDAVLFSFTDFPVMMQLGLMRKETFADNGGFQPVNG
ncbi:MAG: cupin domain-containing protein [Acidobacteria bacterium]|nr:cupin domain-containing protein [Acidobacteriota bacterium]